MSVAGIGVDLIGVERVRKLKERFGERFFGRFFGEGEAVPRSVESVAGRIAAKEAVMKVLKTGWGRGVRWVDVVIVEGGEPKVVLQNKALAVANELGIGRIHLSITHDGGFAVAVAVGETG